MDIAVEKLNIPWRRGDIGGVLVKCRKVLQEQKEITSRLLLAIPLYCETTIGLIKIPITPDVKVIVVLWEIWL